MNELDFILLRGIELALKTQNPQLGILSFATDISKIFFDVLDEITDELIHKAGWWWRRCFLC